MTTDQNTRPPFDLNAITLAAGGHSDRDEGVCLLEAVAWWAGKAHTDRPPCVSEILGGYGRALNDALPDDTRQLLRPLIPALPGTAGDGLDERRGYMALDWLIRVYTPTWLRLVPALVADADALAGFRSIAALEDAAAVGQLVRDAASHSDAARAAASAAAWAAARAAARDAAWAAAWDAAWAAASDAARDAARAAARDAARAAASAAARAAAWDALAPTVAALQQSAIDLFQRMVTCEVGE